MATKKQAMKMAKGFGAEIDCDIEVGMASAWLPKGKAWQESGADVVMVNYGYKGQMSDIWDDLIELMGGGVV